LITDELKTNEDGGISKMPSNIGLYLVRLLSFVACCLSPVICYAQSYPTHPIQVIVPFAGGSASDVITRVVLERMGDTMGRRFIIDNRPGAGGNTGTAAAARAEPDGYTLVMSTSGPLAANKTLYQDLGYDPEKDFAPIGLFAMIPNIIVVSTKFSIASLDEFIAYEGASG
jgi:tripartite-type tricarboxylate transporter receptor subunit TctC